MGGRSSAIYAFLQCGLEYRGLSKFFALWFLTPAGENKLEAKSNFKVAASTKVVATITLPGKKPINVRFVIK